MRAGACSEEQKAAHQSRRRMTSQPTGGKQVLVTLRHALRQDEIDSGNWAFTAERPWDPPLAGEGVQQVTAGHWRPSGSGLGKPCSLWASACPLAGQSCGCAPEPAQHPLHSLLALSALPADGSTGLRQPARAQAECRDRLLPVRGGEVVQGLRSARACRGRLVYDTQVLSTAFLAGQGPHPEQSTRDWMWMGRDIATVWPDLAGSGASCWSRLLKLPAACAEQLWDAGPSSVADTDFPSFPETYVDAHIRYTEALQVRAGAACLQHRTAQSP